MVCIIQLTYVTNANNTCFPRTLIKAVSAAGASQTAATRAACAGASCACELKQCQQQTITCCLKAQQNEDSSRDCICEGAGVWQPRLFLVRLGDVVQAAGQQVVGSEGAEHSLDDLVGPQHPFLVKEHVDHVQDPGCQESQETNQEVGDVEASQCFHLILHDTRECFTLCTQN